MPYPMFLLALKCISLIAVVRAATFYFDPNTPMPRFITSKIVNTSKPRLEIPMIVEYANISMGILPITLEYAIDGLKNATPFLNDFELQINFHESYCDDSQAVVEASSILRLNDDSNNLPIDYSSGCALRAQRVIAEIVNYYNYTAVSQLGIENPDQFKHYYSLSESEDSIVLSALTFFKSQNWTYFALIADDSPFYNPVGFFLFSHFFQKSNLTTFHS